MRIPFRRIKDIAIRLLVLGIVVLLANFISSFLLGVLLSFSSNIRAIGLNSISFDPLITIAYILLFYFTTLYYQPKAEYQYFLFVLTLFLSFTVNFIQGALFLIAFYFLLRKVRMI